MDSDDSDSNLFLCVSSEDSSTSSSEDEDILLEILTSVFHKSKRISIENYIDTIARYSEIEFVRHFRINRELHNYIYTRYQESTEFKKLKINSRSKTASFHLLVFLWYAGHERASYPDISDRFNISLSTVHVIIRRITYFISSLSKEFIKWPKNEELEVTSTYYYEKYKFPGVIGSVDGTHIVIDPPKHGKNQYFNRKGQITLHMQGICNEKKKFIDVFVGYPGSTHDARVFQNSSIFKRIENLPPGKHILADSAYPCLEHVLTPYKDNGHLNNLQKNYNYKLSQCRVDVENCFGILKQRFRQLYFCKLKKIEFLCHFTVACCVLHNLSNIEENEYFEPLRTEDTMDDTIPKLTDGDSKKGKAVRDALCSDIYSNSRKRTRFN